VATAETGHRHGIVPLVVLQHWDEVVSLCGARRQSTSAPDFSLSALQRLDDRLTAHFDGLAIAGDEGWMLFEPALGDISASSAFAGGAVALEAGRLDWLDSVVVFAKDAQEALHGVMAALGWASRRQLQGVVADMLRSNEPARRVLGLAACALHRVDPGLMSHNLLEDSSAVVRARAFRAAGEIGCLDAITACQRAMGDEDPACRWWATVSAVLLGSGGGAVGSLRDFATADGPRQARAFRLALQKMSVSEAHELLQSVAKSGDQRLLTQGAGLNGDPTYVSWLIDNMRHPEFARVAGEAFSLITGANLDKLQLFDEQPDGFEGPPNDDASDTGVEIDPDQGLLWPHVDKITKWWSKSASQFQKGARYFLGAPVTREGCTEVLKAGFQRQRILAAYYLCLLDPGTPLFNTSAPARRQQHVLSGMS
jgi:uncharacterized protein (TIGR02270 family)